MKLEARMYIRTKDGFIDKVIDYNGKCNNPNCNRKHISCVRNYYDENDVLKTSNNIIDLIEKKDIILGKDGNIYEVSKVFKGYVYTKTKTKEKLVKTLIDYQIDKVLTHEQFEK